MKGVTHVCMDRVATTIEKGIEYISPQYIVDSINNLFLLPTKPYMPGQVSSLLNYHYLASTTSSESLYR